MAFIKIKAIGNVGQQPTVSRLPSGDLVANFSIASTKKWKDKTTGDQREQTEWLRVTAFGGLANIVQNFVHQGSKVYLEGEYRTSKYMKDGVEVTGVEMRLAEIELLGEPKGQQAGANSGQGYQQPAQQKGAQQRQHPAQQGGYQRPVSQRQQPAQQGGYQHQGRHNPRQQAPQQGDYQHNGDYGPGNFEHQ